MHILHDLKKVNTSNVIVLEQAKPAPQIKESSNHLVQNRQLCYFCLRMFSNTLSSHLYALQ